MNQRYKVLLEIGRPRRDSMIADYAIIPRQIPTWQSIPVELQLRRQTPETLLDFRVTWTIF